MDAIISSMIPLETAEAGPLILAWGVFLYLVLSLPDKQDYHPLMVSGCFLFFCTNKDL